MSSTFHGDSPAESLAFFEVDETGPDPRQILASVHPALRVTRSTKSPTGFAWYELNVEHASMEDRAIIVGRALRALTAAAEAGELTDFRILQGEHFIEVAPSLVAARRA